MRVGGTVGFVADKPIISLSDIEEAYRRRKESGPGATDLSVDEAIKKVEEAKHAASQTTFEMMDRHHEMVKKSQELLKALNRKRALERLAQKSVEEHREILAEMAIRNAQRRDLMEAVRRKER